MVDIEKKIKLTPDLFLEWKDHPVTHNLRISIKERLIYCENFLFGTNLEYSDHYERLVAATLAEMELLRSLHKQMSSFSEAKDDLDVSEEDENEEEK